MSAATSASERSARCRSTTMSRSTAGEPVERDRGRCVPGRVAARPARRRPRGFSRGAVTEAVDGEVAAHADGPGDRASRPDELRPVGASTRAGFLRAVGGVLPGAEKAERDPVRGRNMSGNISSKSVSTTVLSASRSSGTPITSSTYGSPERFPRPLAAVPDRAYVSPRWGTHVDRSGGARSGGALRPDGAGRRRPAGAARVPHGAGRDARRPRRCGARRIPLARFPSRAPGPGDRLTLDEAVSRLGLDRAAMLRTWRAAGFPEPEQDAKVFTPGDLSMFTVMQAGLDYLGEEVVIQLIRVLGAASARVADASISAFMVNVAPQALEEDPSGPRCARQHRHDRIDRCADPRLRHPGASPHRARLPSGRTAGVEPRRRPRAPQCRVRGSCRLDVVDPAARLQHALAPCRFETRAGEIIVDHRGRGEAHR